jgi:alkylation response protein AidB-like acyl-CoA dehydrogenase
VIRTLWNDDHVKLRREVIAFFEEAKQPEWLLTEPESDEYREMGRAMDLQLIERGWYTLHWPAEYGGYGDFIRHTILRELEGYYRVPTYGGHGRFIVGPALLQFGSPEQQETYLPGIADGSLVICEGLTEPDAGSDLGSLRATARRDGDSYIIDGTKLYVTYGHYANAMLLAARTDPSAHKHQGVSLFLIDMGRDGMSSSPLMCITGHQVNEVVFQNVAIPAATLLGEENRGFYHMALALNYERSGVNAPARYMAELEDIVEVAKRNGRWSDPAVRDRCGRLATMLSAWRVMGWRVAGAQARGEVPTWEASVAELYRKNTNPLMGDLLLEVFGPDALLSHGEQQAILHGRLEYDLLESFNNHGQGGLMVTKNAIARRGLKLPRE